MSYSNPISPAEMQDLIRSNPLHPRDGSPDEQYMPQAYFLVPPPTQDGPVKWRLFDAAYIKTGVIDPNRLGTGATGAGNLYLADDGTWKVISGAPGVGDMLKSTYDTDNTGVVDNAERIAIIGRNSTGVTLYRGTIVYISGSTGNRPNFVKAQANAEPTSAGTFGVVLNDIANNSDGYVAHIGVLDNLDTRSSAPNPFTDVTLADGDTIYLHPTIAGYITNVKPSAPNHLVYVGKVTRTSPTNGTIVYRIQNGYELDELHDVAISSKANNDLLVYESSTSLWKNKTIAAIFGGTPLVSVPTLDQVTAAGSTTTNLITVGGLTVATNLIYTDTVNGRVGIGTTTPTLTFDINTNFNFNTGVGRMLNIRANTNPTVLAGFGTGINFALKIGSGIVEDVAQIDAVNNQTFRSSDLIFRVSQGSSPLEAMRINYLGGVQIGTTTNAGFRLDVNGTARIQNQLTTTGTITAASAIARGVYLNQTLTAAANNDVLVGLDVVSNFVPGSFTGLTYRAARFSTTIEISANGSAVLVNPSGNGTTSEYIGFNQDRAKFGLDSSTTSTYIYASSGRNIDFRIVSTSYMRMMSSGNVILQSGGTFTDAGYRLDVGGTTRLNGTLLVNGATTLSSTLAVTNTITATGGITSGILGYAITSIPTNTTFTNDTTRIIQSPATWIWHDILAFNRLTANYETYNGTTWSSATLNTELFAQKQNQTIAIIDNTTVFGARWTFTNIAAGWSSAEWMTLGITWSASQATVNILLESWDGTTWNTRHSSSTTASATNYFGYISPYNGDTQLRLTITRTGGGNLFNLSNIRFLSARPGDQGAGMEEHFPMYWDGNKNIGLGVSATSNIKFNISGVVNASSNYVAGAKISSTLTAIANNDLLIGLEVNPILSVGSYTGLTINGIRSSINSGTNYWNLFISGTASNYLNGKLLIGTTTDAGYKLDVNGTIRGTAVSVVGGTSSQFLKADGSIDSSTYLKLIDSFDTRASATTPQTYDKQIRFDFKQNSTNGLSDGGIYNGVLYWRKYGATTDWSGGGAIEIAYTDNGNLWHRYGSGTTWNAWRRVWNDNDFSSTSITNWNTAYTNRITSLTTTGSSGAATLVSNVLNIPNYTLAGLGYTTPTLTQVTTAGATTTNAITVGGLTVNGNILTGTAFSNNIGASASPFANLYVVNITSAANLTAFATQDLLLGTSGNTALRIFQTTRNVVIQSGGTFTDAGYRLDVNGTIRSQNKLTVVQSTSGQNIQEWYNSTTLRASMNDVGAFYLQNLEGTDGPVVANSGTLSTVSGWTGTITIFMNPPGQQNIQVDKGIIVNVF